MKEKAVWRGLGGRALMIVLGNLMYAMAVNLFIVPNDLITGEPRDWPCFLTGRQESR